MYYNEFLLWGVILEPESKISRTTTLEFHNFSRVFQDLCLFPGLSRPGNLNILISGLSRVCSIPGGCSLAAVTGSWGCQKVLQPH